MQHQTRSLPLEIKRVSGRKFEGHGSIFGNTDLGGDIVLPGAFARTLADHKAKGTMPLMFWMHQPDQVPGVWLDMAEDKDGLFVAGELVDTGLGRDVSILLDRKAVRGLSIGYGAEEVAWGREGERLLKQVALHEVSIVSMAMNPLARVEALKARLSRDGEYVPTERELERLFRDAGCSKAVSRTLITRLMIDTSAGGMPAPRWDAGAVDDDEEKAAAQSALRLLDLIGAQALQRP